MRLVHKILAQGEMASVDIDHNARYIDFSKQRAWKPLKANPHVRRLRDLDLIEISTFSEMQLHQYRNYPNLEPLLKENISNLEKEAFKILSSIPAGFETVALLIRSSASLPADDPLKLTKGLHTFIDLHIVASDKEFKDFVEIPSDCKNPHHVFRDVVNIEDFESYIMVKQVVDG